MWEICKRAKGSSNQSLPKSLTCSRRVYLAAFCAPRHEVRAASNAAADRKRLVVALKDLDAKTDAVEATASKAPAADVENARRSCRAIV